MSQESVMKLRELYNDWIKDDTISLDKVELFERLLEYTSETQKDICGKCIPCRDGIPIIKALVNKFEDGTASKEDLIKIEDYVANLRSSKCSVGIDYGKNMEVILRNNFNDFYKKVR